jgi:hypothetical protein
MFEGRYLREVGRLYAELDDWKAKIAELFAMEDGTDEAKSAAVEARTHAEESYAAAHGEAAAAPNFTPSPELKFLFREVAKRVHPDFASGDADKTVRERLMSEANRAYQRGDADELRRILEEYESSPEAVQGTGIAADLLRVIRQIGQIHQRLGQISGEVSALISSDISKLMAKVETARLDDRDPLVEMAKEVREQIKAARIRYQVLFDLGSIV